MFDNIAHNMETEAALVDARKEKRIPVVEIFGPTIQGEGAVAGCQTFFLRLGLCDYKCVKCDSLHAVDPKAVKAHARRLTQKEIADEVLNQMSHTEWLTLSGGNPCIHDLSEFVATIKAAGKKICVETQGTKCPKWLDFVDLITVSPKGPGMGEKFNFQELMHFVCQYAHKLCIKFVTFSAQDLEFVAGVIEELEKVSDDDADLAYGIGDIIDNRFYISLGNPTPPTLDSSLALNDVSPDNHVLDLLKSYDILAQQIMQDKRLLHAKFLPQLHVLVWGNQKGK